jgi:hypothetical protein
MFVKLGLVVGLLVDTHDEHMSVSRGGSDDHLLGTVGGYSVSLHGNKTAPYP